MALGKHEIKRHPFFPMIEFHTISYTNSSCRSVKRCRKWDDRWYGRFLPALFGRQVGKLMVHKGKPLMELPYSSETSETPECEEQYLLHSRKYWKPKDSTLTKKEADVEAILDAELYGENEP